jgi:uncharacterized protein (DUF697 family)
MITKILNGFNTATQFTNILNGLTDMNQEEKTQKANYIIQNHVGYAASAGLIPFPGADLAAVTAVQLNMLRQIAKLYDVNFMDNIGKNMITAIAGGSIARLGASLIKAIPGVGTFIGEMGMAAMSGASTYALGKVFANHFSKGGTLEDFDLKKSKKVYEEELKKGKTVAAEVVKVEEVKKEDAGDELMNRLKKLADLKEAGVLTDEEFKQMKGKLLAQF